MDASNLSLKEHQKKLIAVLISALLAVLLLIIIVLVNIAQKANILPQITTSTKPEGSNVNLKKEYENPFSRSTQYINPFSDYKNPFDSLIQ